MGNSNSEVQQPTSPPTDESQRFENIFRDMVQQYRAEELKLEKCRDDIRKTEAELLRIKKKQASEKSLEIQLKRDRMVAEEQLKTITKANDDMIASAKKLRETLDEKSNLIRLNEIKLRNIENEIKQKTEEHNVAEVVFKKEIIALKAELADLKLKRDEMNKANVKLSAVNSTMRRNEELLVRMTTVRSENGSAPAKRLLIPCESVRYNEIGGLFMETTQKHFQIHEIQEIIDSHAETRYNLNKREYKEKHPHKNITEKLLFRGIRRDQVDRFISNGFDSSFWNKENGITFTSVSNYAMQHSDVQGIKHMIVFKVVVCEDCKRTTRDERKHKKAAHTLHDELFYPVYLIKFTGDTYRIVKPKNPK